MATTAYLDVRALPGTREAIAYSNGGLFPVVAAAADGSLVAAARGGAGHLGLAGRIDVIRSRDRGLTWTAPGVVADSAADDRNPALGASSRGTLILAYYQVFSYDAQGRYVPREGSTSVWNCQVKITRSHDSGLTWEEPYVLTDPHLRTGSAYGKIVQLGDTLILPIYNRAIPELGAVNPDPPYFECSYIIRSQDDGLTWGEPSLVSVEAGETALLALPGGELLAVTRRQAYDRSLWSLRSADGGVTWSEPVQVTGAMQHPGDLLLLKNGDILLTYGNRNHPPCRVEGRVSSDGGRSWLPCLLAFSGQLGGYTSGSPRRADLGYPSSILSGDRGVTLYYCNPALPRHDHWQSAQSAGYSATGYAAIAVSWDQDKLITAVRRTCAL